MKHRYTALFSLAFLLLTLHISSPQLWAQRKVLRVMSYNVENFFDTEDDPTHDDDSFLPTGEHHWAHARYQTKIQHIAEVISAVGGEAFPDLIALIEVENATVLSDLLHRTALGEKVGYRHIITHGEDKRGINVALLYGLRPSASSPPKRSLFIFPLIRYAGRAHCFVSRVRSPRATHSTSSSVTSLRAVAEHWSRLATAATAARAFVSRSIA